MKVIHLLDGLRVGGKERAALQLASYGREQGQDHSLVLFDFPYRPDNRDFDPERVPWRFLPRQPGFDISFALRLGNLLKRESVDIVHAHNETAIVYGNLGLSLARNRRTRLIGTYHTWPGAGSFRARLLARWAARRSASVVAVSDDLAARLRRGGWTGPCCVVPNGVDTAWFFPAIRPSGYATLTGRTKRYVVNVARCDPIKGQADLIAAADIVHRECPEAVFLIAGEGPLLANLRQLASGRRYVRCVGVIHDVLALLRRADLFVLASHDEGTPLALLEALAAGCPSIATDVGGVRGVLTAGDNKAGLLVPPHDPVALASAILKVLREPDCAATLRQAGRVRARAFSAQRMWQSYYEMYQA